MLLTPPQPPNRHCSRPPPWHPHSLALNRYEQPIHKGRVFSICSKANISWQTTTIEVTKQASKNFPTSSVSKIEIFAAKELCGSRAISAQISLSEKPYWHLGQIQCRAKHEDNLSKSRAGRSYISERQQKATTVCFLHRKSKTDRLYRLISAVAQGVSFCIQCPLQTAWELVVVF